MQIYEADEIDLEIKWNPDDELVMFVVNDVGVVLSMEEAQTVVTLVQQTLNGIRRGMCDD
jgi:hypothetical protein